MCISININYIHITVKFMLNNIFNKRRAEDANPFQQNPDQVGNKRININLLDSAYNKINTLSSITNVNTAPKKPGSSIWFQQPKKCFSLKPRINDNGPSFTKPTKFGPSSRGDMDMGQRLTIEDRVNRLGRDQWEQARKDGLTIEIVNDKTSNPPNLPIASDGTLFSSRIAYIRDLYKAAFNKAEKNKEIRTRISISTDWARDLGKSKGDERFRKMQSLLNNIAPGFVRSPDQLLFHKFFTIAVLPHIFGSDWESNCVRIMEELEIDKITYEVMAMTPRRWGKTWSVAMFILALVLCVPGIRVGVFSTGGRASGSLMSILKTFMKSIPGAEARICKSSKEELFIAATPCGGTSSMQAKSAQDEKTTSKIFSYPSEVKGEYLSTIFISRIHFYYSFHNFLR